MYNYCVSCFIVFPIHVHHRLIDLIDISRSDLHLFRNIFGNMQNTTSFCKNIEKTPPQKMPFLSSFPILPQGLLGAEFAAALPAAARKRRRTRQRRCRSAVGGDLGDHGAPRWCRSRLEGTSFERGEFQRTTKSSIGYPIFMH